jgi:DNA-binding transcriptional LysR family regulator
VSSTILVDVPEGFARFRRSHPDVELRLHEGFTATIAERLREGDIDAALIRDLAPDPVLAITRHATERFVAVLPASHPRAGQRTIDAGTLRDEPFVFFPRSAGELAYARNLEPCRERGFEPRIVQEALHWSTVLQLVAVGVGVTIAPVSAASAAPPAVRCVALRGSRASSDIQLVHRAGDDRALVAAFGAAVSATIAR